MAPLGGVVPSGEPSFDSGCGDPGERCERITRAYNFLDALVSELQDPACLSSTAIKVRTNSELNRTKPTAAITLTCVEEKNARIVDSKRHSSTFRHFPVLLPELPSSTSPPAHQESKPLDSPQPVIFTTIQAESQRTHILVHALSMHFVRTG